MKRFLVSTMLLMFLFSTSVFSAHLHRESWYQKRWCENRKGVVEAPLSYQTRCDCLTETHAIEFDFAKKWAEAIGQSLWYASQTGMKPGIVLIIERDKDQKYVDILLATIQFYGLPIDVWTMTSEGFENEEVE